MALPILGPILAQVGKLVLPKVGSLLKGKLTNVGVATAAVGAISLGASDQDIFASIKVLVSLVEQAWPHILVVIGGLMAVAGWFRKAGWAAALESTKKD